MVLSEVSASYSPFSLFCVFLCPLREIFFSFILSLFVKFLNAYKPDLEGDQTVHF